MPDHTVAINFPRRTYDHRSRLLEGHMGLCSLAIVLGSHLSQPSLNEEESHKCSK